nr:DUF4037 domain-containing protein [Anaerolineae bacterium]
MRNIASKQVQDDLIKAILSEILTIMPNVHAAAVGGSAATGLSDARSDIDLYVYIDPVPALDVRTTLAENFTASRADIGLDPFGPGDEWIAEPSGIHVDIMYWAPEWIEEQVAQVLDRHEAWVGYTTCFWYTMLHSQVVYDPEGWFARLQEHAREPYPDELVRAIVDKNFPILRDTHSSYCYQIESALFRQDRISLNHRVAVLLASYMDIIFAINKVPNPGEKRLIEHVLQLSKYPPLMQKHVEQIIAGIVDDWDNQQTLVYVDSLVDELEILLRSEEYLS